MFEIPDREVLVVSADVPPQAGETVEQHQQRENTNAARVRTMCSSRTGGWSLPSVMSD
jgi:hypothetical protein